MKSQTVKPLDNILSTSVDKIANQIFQQRRNFLTVLFDPANFDQATVDAFTQSRQENGMYQISEQDSIIIKNSKMLLNIFTDLEKFIPQIVKPFSEFLESESPFAFLSLGKIIGQNVLQIPDIVQFFRNIGDLTFYFDLLQKEISALPGCDKSFLNLLDQLKQSLSETVLPLVNKVKLLVPAEEKGHQERIQALQEVVEKTEELGEENDYLQKLYKVLDQIKQKANLLIGPRPSHKDIYKTTPNDSTTISTLIHAENAISHFQHALNKVIRMTKNWKDLHIFDTLKDLGLAIQALQNIDLNLVKQEGREKAAEELQEIIRSALVNLQPLLSDLACKLDITESRLGIKNERLVGEFEKLCHNFSALAKQMDVPLQKEVPFWKDRLKVRKNDLQRNKLRQQELFKLKTILEKNPITPTTPLEILLTIQKLAKKVASPKIYHFNLEIDFLIAERTGLNKLNAEIEVLEKNFMTLREKHIQNKKENAENEEQIAKLTEIKVFLDKFLLAKNKPLTISQLEKFPDMLGVSREIFEDHLTYGLLKNNVQAKIEKIDEELKILTIKRKQINSAKQNKDEEKVALVKSTAKKLLDSYDPTQPLSSQQMKELQQLSAQDNEGILNELNHLSNDLQKRYQLRNELQHKIINNENSFSYDNVKQAIVNTTIDGASKSKIPVEDVLRLIDTHLSIFLQENTRLEKRIVQAEMECLKLKNPTENSNLNQQIRLLQKDLHQAKAELKQLQVDADQLADKLKENNKKLLLLEKYIKYEQYNLEKIGNILGKDPEELQDNPNLKALLQNKIDLIKKENATGSILINNQLKQQEQKIYAIEKQILAAFKQKEDKYHISEDKLERPKHNKNQEAKYFDKADDISAEELTHRLAIEKFGLAPHKLQQSKQLILENMGDYLDPKQIQLLHKSKNKEGIYISSVKDSLMIKNIKAILNTLKQMEDLAILLKFHLDNLTLRPDKISSYLEFIKEKGFFAIRHHYLALQKELTNLVHSLNEMKLAFPGVTQLPLVKKLKDWLAPSFNFYIQVMKNVNITETLADASKIDVMSNLKAALENLQDAAEFSHVSIEPVTPLTIFDKAKDKIKDYGKTHPDQRDNLNILSNIFSDLKDTAIALIKFAENKNTIGSAQMLYNILKLLHKFLQLDMAPFMKLIPSFKKILDDTIKDLHKFFIEASIWQVVREKEFGFKSGLLEGPVKDLCLLFEDAAKKIGTPLNSYYPYTKQIMRALNEERQRKDLSPQKLDILNETAAYFQSKMSSQLLARKDEYPNLLIKAKEDFEKHDRTLIEIEKQAGLYPYAFRKIIKPVNDAFMVVSDDLHYSDELANEVSKIDSLYEKINRLQFNTLKYVDNNSPENKQFVADLKKYAPKAASDYIKLFQSNELVDETTWSRESVRLLQHMTETKYGYCQEINKRIFKPTEKAIAKSNGLSSLRNLFQTIMDQFEDKSAIVKYQKILDTQYPNEGEFAKAMANASSSWGQWWRRNITQPSLDDLLYYVAQNYHNVPKKFTSTTKATIPPKRDQSVHAIHSSLKMPVASHDVKSERKPIVPSSPKEAHHEEKQAPKREEVFECSISPSSRFTFR